MRIFLFELFQGVTIGTSVPQTQGVSPTMLANLDAVLTAARRHGVWVYLTALEGNSLGAAAGPSHDECYNVVNNVSGEGDAFNAISPRILRNLHKECLP